MEPGEAGTAGLPAINEHYDELPLPYSPTRLIKESLRLHGRLNKDLDSLSSKDGRPKMNNEAYDAFCESNYRANLRKAAYYGDYNEASSRSNSYSKKLRRIKERTQRHGDFDDLDKLYSSDVSALKKLQMTENNAEKFDRSKALGANAQAGRDDNFA